MMMRSSPELYAKAPLPFVGQKRNFIKRFVTALDDIIPDDGALWTIIDVFGGSGLLANTAKYFRPAATVVWNDYDNYAERLENIPDTNRLLRHIREITAPYPQKIPLEKCQELATMIRSFDGFVDVQTLAANLKFSGRQYADINQFLACKCYYHRTIASDYAAPPDYLTGCVRVRADFESLLDEYACRDKVLLILDPPYLSTSQGAYKLANYFGVCDFLRLVTKIQPPFVFFSSTRSEFIDYLNFSLKNKYKNYEALQGLTTVSANAVINVHASYTDTISWHAPAVSCRSTPAHRVGNVVGAAP